MADYASEYLASNASGRCTALANGVTVCEESLTDTNATNSSAVSVTLFSSLPSGGITEQDLGDGAGTISIGDGDGDSGSVIVIVQASGAVGDDDEDKLLVSGVVDIIVENTTTGGLVVIAELTVAESALTLGGAICSIPTVIGVLFQGQGTDDDCKAGCCTPGAPDACVCDDELTTGERCDRTLQCSAQSDATGGHDTSACTTRSGGEGSSTVTCQCTEMRQIAVFATKVLPKVRREYGSDQPSEVNDMLSAPPPGLFVILALLLIVGTVAFLCYRADRATLYVATTRVPDHFYPITWRELLALNLRLYMSIARPFNVLPGYTAYTRLQVIALISIVIIANACGALLFAGTLSEIRTRNLLEPNFSTMPAG